MSERIEVSVEDLIEDIRKNVVDTEDFNRRVVGAYNDGTAEKGLEADDQVVERPVVLHRQRRQHAPKLQTAADNLVPRPTATTNAGRILHPERHNILPELW